MSGLEEDGNLSKTICERLGLLEQVMRRRRQEHGARHTPTIGVNEVDAWCGELAQLRGQLELVTDAEREILDRVKRREEGS